MWKEEAPLLTRQTNVCGSMRQTSKRDYFKAWVPFVPIFLLYTLEVSIINRKVVPNNVNDDLVNEKIRFKEVLVIGPTGQQLGVKTRLEALEIAYSQNLDLLCVSPNSNPPVCKILNYGKYHFEQQKKAKEAKKKQHVTEVKPLRLSPVIDTHDFETKLRQARKWAEDGMKVKIDMRFRGRMMTRVEVGTKIMDEFVEAMSDVANVERKPKLEGNTMSCVLTPKKAGK